MSLKLAFWIIILILVLFFGVGLIAPLEYRTGLAMGFSPIVIVLFIIIGWQVFGAPIQ